VLVLVSAISWQMGVWTERRRWEHRVGVVEADQQPAAREADPLVPIEEGHTQTWRNPANELKGGEVEQAEGDQTVLPPEDVHASESEDVHASESAASSDSTKQVPVAARPQPHHGEPATQDESGSEDAPLTLDDLLAPIRGQWTNDSYVAPFALPAHESPFAKPSALSPETILAQNQARFPSEPYWPPGYDVQTPSFVSTKASAKLIWRSRAAKTRNVEQEKRRWGPAAGESDTPGTLLLNMLIKDEAENLRRSLPRWAKLIDYFIIGVDDANSDDSVAIIKQYLGHLPGEICEVHFDGIGPTWNAVLQMGILHFPGATHGIAADADFTPIHSALDRNALSLRENTLRFLAWDEQQITDRPLDWIYRNIPGARVIRRAHHAVVVPYLPGQRGTLDLIRDLECISYSGGYGDRSGVVSKHERYIAWLTKDYEERPQDEDLLYYRAMSHLEIFSTRRAANISVDPVLDVRHLEWALYLFEQRASLPVGSGEGNNEARWLSIHKQANIYSDYTENKHQAELLYLRAIRTDPHRIDSYFYLQHMYAVNGTQEKWRQAERILRYVFDLHIPIRHWQPSPLMYTCFRYTFYARAVNALRHPTEPMITRALEGLNHAKCSATADPNNNPQVVRQLKKEVQQKKKLVLGK
jgi:hypothetical protein